MARALCASAHGQPEQALHLLEQAAPLAAAEDTEGLSLRMRCSFYLTLADAQEYLGRAPQALASMRQWQCLQTARANLASRARYQAAALQTELLRLQHKLEENEAHRRATERARGQLQAANEALSRRVEEVQALRAALQEQAVRDALTGLFNRAAYQVAFEARLTRAVAERQAFWVMLIDLDRFKAINDTFGHAVGDELLVEVGARLRDILGPHAVVARLGGDEFAALIDDPPGGEGARRELGCDLARAIVGGLGKLVTPSGQILHAGASVGLAHCPQDGGTPTDLQIHADLALYAAKSEGRGT